MGFDIVPRREPTQKQKTDYYYENNVDIFIG